MFFFNYSIEKARAAIDFIDAPERIESALTEILNQGIAYHDDKQNRFLDDTKKFLNNSRVSHIASEDVRLGTAAQQYDNQLRLSLDATGASVLDSRGVITQLLTQHTDLIRFNLDKLDEVFTFYKRDFENFEKALNKEFGTQVESAAIEIDDTLLEIGSNYAVSVIDAIDRHLGK